MNPHTVLHCTTHNTQLGPVLLLASPHGLAGLWFEGQRHHPSADRVAQWTVAPRDPLLREAERQLDSYFGAQGHRFDLPLDLCAGTPFQQSVWRTLLGIPGGHTCSYQTLAQKIGRPLAMRAVGAAVGRNPLSIVVPCHRVVGSDGSLTGYAGGLERKRELLRLESALIVEPHQSTGKTASAQIHPASELARH
jgi:methylated-DNA-[protein]-cysteine S-methyltransferase